MKTTLSCPPNGAQAVFAPAAGRRLSPVDLPLLLLRVAERAVDFPWTRGASLRLDAALAWYEGAGATANGGAA